MIIIVGQKIKNIEVLWLFLLLHCQDQERALLLVAWIFSKAACTLNCSFNYRDHSTRGSNALISAHNGTKTSENHNKKIALIKALLYLYLKMKYLEHFSLGNMHHCVKIEEAAALIHGGRERRRRSFESRRKYAHPSRIRTMNL